MSQRPNNQEIAHHLSLISQLLDLDKQQWPSRAYRAAAETVATHTEDLTKSSSIPGIGPSISSTIGEFVKTGTSSRFKKLTKAYPAEALSMTVVPGVGPKTALRLHAEGIRDLESLVSAAHANKLEPKLKNAVLFAVRSQERLPLPVARLVGQEMIEQCVKRGALRAELAGSIRRGRETVKDIDLLVIAHGNAKEAILRYFKSLGQVLVSGDVKTSIRRTVKLGLREDSLSFQVQCDLWFVEADCWGSAMAYATGSKEHNVMLRSLAKQKGIKINEHGFWKGTKRLGGKSEKTLYKLLDLPFCPPELREGTEARSKIPKLVEASDLSCDLHHHSCWSPDVSKEYTQVDVAMAAKNEGLEAVAITDHSYAPGFRHTHALDDFIRKCRQAEKAAGVRVLAGVECDIMGDGSLQWNDNDLQRLDLVVAAIHKKHSVDVEHRLISAIKHPLVDVIAHPTGRMFGKRECDISVNWKKVFKAAAKHNVALEINGGDDRLDLPAELISLAIEAGCKFTLSSDSHSGGHIRYSLSNALTQARRAGLRSKHLYNISV
jgi:DNA polymerase (family 10)